MRKLFITMSVALFTLAAQAQVGKVGVNEDTPKATLDIEAKTTTGTAVEGLLIPRISREKAATMSNPVTETEVSTLVYINDATAPASDAASTTTEVTETGFYFFDGAKWNRMKVDTNTTSGTTQIKTLEYAINAVPIDSSTPTDSETCIGNLCVRLNETNAYAGNAIVQYKLLDLSSENLNVWGEKTGGGGTFHEVQHEGLTWVQESDGWQNFEVWPHVSNSDMARYSVSFINTKQLYRINVSVNPENTSSGLISGVSIYIERLFH